jgi:hypothetical protein
VQNLDLEMGSWDEGNISFFRNVSTFLSYCVTFTPPPQKYIQFHYGEGIKYYIKFYYFVDIFVIFSLITILCKMILTVNLYGIRNYHNCNTAEYHMKCPRVM